ncbi:hypothetical protein [Novosphingobium guangzhouense]|uniref:Uncharacterized protein n=1 Tax=Novosphingobium guangzhouense TaxID=1850347 RepID=A0A2K2G0S4_9SPHN|nr:hypothetical protein [Novosphingobium guangzhouense]PNU04602.1 hypothetical protein A8V01_19530 [Novosphingobium guangzhouense]
MSIRLDGEEGVELVFDAGKVVGKESLVFVGATREAIIVEDGPRFTEQWDDPSCDDVIERLTWCAENLICKWSVSTWLEVHAGIKTYRYFIRIAEKSEEVRYQLTWKAV